MPKHTHSRKQTRSVRSLWSIVFIDSMADTHARIIFKCTHSQPNVLAYNKPSCPKKPPVEPVIVALTRAHLVAINRQAGRPPAACADFPATELVALILLCIRRSG